MMNRILSYPLALAFTLVASPQAFANLQCGYIISLAGQPEASEFTTAKAAVKLQSVHNQSKIWLYSNSGHLKSALLEEARILSGKKVCAFFEGSLGRINSAQDANPIYSGMVGNIFEDSPEGWAKHRKWADNR